MELRMQSHHWEQRAPDWAAAAVCGFAAGAAVMVLELFWSTMVSGGSPWRTSHMVAALVLGPDALQSMKFSIGIVALALTTHYLLGVVFGLVLAALIAPFKLDSSAAMVLLTGALFGLVLYLFNFYGMVRLFAWFAELRGGPTLVAHLIFGMAAALMYWQLERRTADQ